MMNNEVVKTKTKTSQAIGISLYAVVYVVLILIAASMVFPFLWMFFTSLKTNVEAISSIKLKLFPEKLMWSNYNKLWQLVPFLQGVGNTMIVEISVIGIGTFVTGLAAFSFAKLKLPCKQLILLVLMSGMMIPYAALMLPQYRVFQAVRLTNTLWPLILPGFFGNITMMFFFIQYMKGVPNALFEAAKIDGSGYFRMYVKIMLPLIGPALAAQVIFWFVGIWNDYFAPSLYLKDFKVMTLQPMLQKISKDMSTDLPLVMAGAVLSSIPMLVIYIFFQRFFIESMAISGVKG